MSVHDNRKVRNTKKSYKLTSDEERLLINFMEEHKFMWDVQSNEYKDVAKKNVHWKKLSSILNKDVLELKKRWKSIKDYRKMNKKKAKVIKSEKWSSDENDSDHRGIEFLDQCETCRTNHSNINDYDEEENDFKNAVSLSSTTLDNPAFTIPQNQNDFTDVTQQLITVPSTSSSTVLPPKCEHTKNNDILNEFLCSRKETNKLLKEIVGMSNQAEVEPPKTNTRRYFEAFANDIEALPIDLQSQCFREVKLAVFNLINKYQELAEEQQQ